VLGFTPTLGQSGVATIKGLSIFDILFSGSALLVDLGLGNPNPTHQFHPPPTLSEPAAPRLVTMINKNLKVFRATSKHYRHIYHFLTKLRPWNPNFPISPRKMWPLKRLSQEGEEGYLPVVGFGSP